MRVRIYSEEFPAGQTADWPLIPREGEVVSFRHKGGTSNLGVREVCWSCDTDGKLEEVEIHLAF